MTRLPATGVGAYCHLAGAVMRNRIEAGSLPEVSGTGSVAGLVGSGAGAGVANDVGGTTNISSDTLDSNHASGARHNAAGGTGTVFASLGAGNGIFDFLSKDNSAFYGPLGESLVTVNDSLYDNNQAEVGATTAPAKGAVLSALRRHDHNYGNRHRP